MSEVIQGSVEWHALRVGKATASRVAEVVAKVKSGGFASSRQNYMAELIAERLTGTVAEGYTNAAMQWGLDTEAEARIAYEFRQGVDVQQVGFIVHPTIAQSGASPDGLVGEVGLLELKCPNTATHIETLIGLALPSKYGTQMQWQMACTGRAWCDFASYDPRMPEAMRLFVRRVARDDKKIAELEAAVVQFLDDMEEKLATLTKLYLWEREAA